MVKLEKLTDSEKSEMKSILLSHIEKVEMEKTKQSMWWTYFNFKKTALAGAFLIIIFFSSMTLLAGNSLPGDSLHSLKLKMENIQESLAFGKEAKLAAKTAQVIERLEEVNKLSIENKLDSIKENQVEELFSQISEDTILYIEILDREKEDLARGTQIFEKTEVTEKAPEPTAQLRALSAEINSEDAEEDIINENPDKIDELKNSLKTKLEDFKESFDKNNKKRPERLMEKVDSLINSIDHPTRNKGIENYIDFQEKDR